MLTDKNGMQAIVDLLVIFFCAWGLAVVLIPIQPSTVECQITLFDSQYEQHVVIGKGEVL